MHYMYKNKETKKQAKISTLSIRENENKNETDDPLPIANNKTVHNLF